MKSTQGGHSPIHVAATCAVDATCIAYIGRGCGSPIVAVSAAVGTATRSATFSSTSAVRPPSSTATRSRTLTATGTKAPSKNYDCHSHSHQDIYGHSHVHVRGTAQELDELAHQHSLIDHYWHTRCHCHSHCNWHSRCNWYSHCNWFAHCQCFSLIYRDEVGSATGWCGAATFRRILCRVFLFVPFQVVNQTGPWQSMYCAVRLLIVACNLIPSASLAVDPRSIS